VNNLNTDRSAETFEKLLKDTLPRVDSHLMVGGFSRIEREDVLSAATEKAFRNFGGLKDLEAFKKWFFMIALNASTDLIRRKTAERQIVFQVVEGLGSLDSDVEDHPLVSVDPYKEIDDQLTVNHALSFLTLKEREILEMRLSGMQWDEIAKDLGRNMKTVMTTSRRAINKLKQRMAGTPK